LLVAITCFGPGSAQQCVHAMLAEEHSLIYEALLDGSCLQADVTQSPALHKHFNVSGHASASLHYMFSAKQFDNKNKLAEVHYLGNFVWWNKTSFATSFTTNVTI